MDIVHRSVLKEEVLDLLVPPASGGLLIDCTIGEGGHSEAFLKRYPDLRVVGLDADSRIMEVAKERLAEFGDRVRFFNTWFNLFFRDYPLGGERPDLILFDLGISSFHYEKSGRGFSFRKRMKGCLGPLRALETPGPLRNLPGIGIIRWKPGEPPWGKEGFGRILFIPTGLPGGRDRKLIPEGRLIRPGGEYGGVPEEEPGRVAPVGENKRRGTALAGNYYWGIPGGLPGIDRDLGHKDSQFRGNPGVYPGLFRISAVKTGETWPVLGKFRVPLQKLAPWGPLV